MSKKMTRDEAIEAIYEVEYDRMTNDLIADILLEGITGLVHYTNHDLEDSYCYYFDEVINIEG